MAELTTKQQKRLHDRLDQIQPKIEREDFLKNQGLGNEIGFYIFDYPPESEITVREHLNYMTERLIKRGRNFKSINLFEAVIELLDSRRITERAFKIQKERGDDALFNALKGPLEQNRVADFIASKIDFDSREKDKTEFILLHGLGSVWPIIRGHGLLNALHAKVGNVPTVLFYPGEYDATVCANRSMDGDSGAIIIKLAENDRVFRDIETFIRTSKFLRSNSGKRPEQQQLLHQKATENQNRNRRLTGEVEEILKDAEFYALGSKQNPRGGAVSSILQELYRYVIENTFSKLKLVKPFPGDIRREIQNTLVADDVSQIGLDLNADQVNPLASLEVEKFLTLGDDTGRPITAEDIVKRFSKRPFGWNDDEIVLIISRLGLANKICFQMRQQEIPLKSAYDNLTQVRKRAELRIRRIKQQSEANLKRAAKLFKNVFGKNAPESEKELLNIAQANINTMKTKLDGFANKASTGHYPGVKAIDNGRVLLAGLIEVQSSYQFIGSFLANGDALLDFEEDYQDLENVYETQFSTWQKLHKALTIDFDRNRIALEKDTGAMAALQKLETIYNKERPYRDIREVEPLIESINKVNEALLMEKRTHAKSRIEHRIEQVQQQIKVAHVPSALSNKVLRPLQLSLKRVNDLTGIAEISQEQADTIAFEEEAHELINKFIEEQQVLLEQKAQEEAEKNKKAGKVDADNGVYQPTKIKPLKIAEPAPKKIVTVDTLSVMREVNSAGVIETEQDINTYLSALKTKLTDLVNSNNKIRIK